MLKLNSVYNLPPSYTVPLLRINTGFALNLSNIFGRLADLRLFAVRTILNRVRIFWEVEAVWQKFDRRVAAGEGGEPPGGGRERRKYVTRE